MLLRTVTELNEGGPVEKLNEYRVSQTMLRTKKPAQ